MKRLIICVFCLVCSLSFSQEKTHTSYFDINYFKGNIALHNPDILHLIKGHPKGIVLSWNRKTYGFKDWEQRYNYPDYGVSFIYQNFKNDVLGNNYALSAHYNFYFLKRNLMMRIGQGFAYNTNPFNREKNLKNIAFGSRILSTNSLMLAYKKERIIDKFGLQAGISLIHYSNASVKAPNTSTNSLIFNVGVTYNLEKEELDYQYTIDKKVDKNYAEPIRYNAVFRAGVNESDVVGSGQYPFYVISAYVDKRINRKSAFQLGADIFFSKFLEELIYYKSVSFPEENVSGNEDYKRVGVFAGHELFINKTSVIAQLGYYAYYPFDFEGRVYTRVGLKRYFGKKWFGALTLKSHAAKAEAVELGVGVRL
ncbi:deacylase [Flavivirga aquatica]|uniref:Deacylase n=1 Tax=Flavivirga aquatica TaxID=1849968 RepID=A0A1E5T9H3_9FLAO|nr:acyloxyacyl hydrolase [Flavivirga aquatica]OEK07986.1 deacylase [Flavivirga aquatica]